MNLESLNNGSIVDAIVQRISESIINGELKPGEKLPTEVEMVEKLGVARNSIREAVKMLSAMGVLEVRRGDGTYIASKISSSVFNPLLFSLIIEAGSSQDIYQLRVMFESAVVSLVIDTATEEDLKAIESNLNTMEDKIKSKKANVDELVKEDIQFHVQVLKATHNPLIERIGKTIVELYPNHVRKSLMQVNGFSRSLHNHQMIFQIIKSRDKQSVYSVVEKSLEEWKADWK